LPFLWIMNTTYFFSGKELRAIPVAGV